MWNESPAKVGHAGFSEGAVRTDDELGPHRVAAISADVPHLLFLVPDRGGHCGLENRQVVQVESFGDALAIRKDLGPAGVVARRHVARLVKQRQVVVGNHVARNAGIPVPVPGATDIGSTLDDTDALETLFPQTGRGQEC